MSAGANVLAIHALDELRSGLLRFGSEAQEALAAEQEIRRTLDWLQQRLSHWQKEVRRRQEAVRQTQAALARCRASEYYDRDGHYHRPDCSAHEQALRRAQAHLREAEQELANTRRWLSAVQQAVADYQRQAQRLGGMLAGDLPKAAALLERKTADLQGYLAVSAAAGVIGVTAAISRLAQAEPQSRPGSDLGAESVALEQALDRLAGSRTGSAAAQAIRERGTVVRFGETGGDAIAHYDPKANEIVLHTVLRQASSSVLAAHLAHEGTHVQWNRDDSIDQEFHAFKAQAEVWEQLKGDETDEQCDWVSSLIRQGEEVAKWTLRDLYPDLPEYA